MRCLFKIADTEVGPVAKTRLTELFPKQKKVFLYEIKNPEQRVRHSGSSNGLPPPCGHQILLFMRVQFQFSNRAVQGGSSFRFGRFFRGKVSVRTSLGECPLKGRLSVTSVNSAV